MLYIDLILIILFIFKDPPGRGEWQLIQTSIRPPLEAYILPSPSILGRGSAVRRIRLKTATVVGTKIVALLFIPAPNCSYAQLQRLIPTPLLSSRCRARFLFGMSGNLRLLFRLVKTGFSTTFSNRCKPPFATCLPPQRGLMNTRTYACGTRFICRRER